MIPAVLVFGFFAAILDLSTGRHVTRWLNSMTTMQNIWTIAGFAAIVVAFDHFFITR